MAHLDEASGSADADDPAETEVTFLQSGIATELENLVAFVSTRLEHLGEFSGSTFGSNYFPRVVVDYRSAAGELPTASLVLTDDSRQEDFFILSKLVDIADDLVGNLTSLNESEPIRQLHADAVAGHDLDESSGDELAVFHILLVIFNS